ncbi:MAG: hypothetical protein ACI865_001758 [Flavobacteriaceae bacterium]|jgi:hypothetical protein
MKPLRVLFFSFTVLFWNSSYSQNLVEAFKHYSQSDYFAYDPEVVEDSKIQSIEKIVFALLGDTLDGGMILERSSFRRDGRPETTENFKTYLSDSSIIKFKYDSLFRLVERVLLKPPTKYPRTRDENRVHEIIKWEYKEDSITKRLHFVAPRRNVSDNETLVLFNCDSIQYSALDTSITVLSNYKEHIKRSEHEYSLAPVAFAHPSQTRLEFYPNYKVKTKGLTLFGRPERITTIDSCGYGNKTLVLIISELIRCETCLSNDLKWLYHERIDSIVNKEDTIEIALFGDYGEGRQTNYFDDLDNGNSVRVFLKDQRLAVQRVFQNMSIMQAGNSHYHTREIKHYDFDMKLLMIERHISSYWDGLPRFDARIYLDSANPVDSVSTEERLKARYEKEDYEYYDNALLKSSSTFNEDGSLTGKTLYQLTYFD